jgi:hypothetical protein
MIEFKNLDKNGLTKCVHPKDTCPHPAICKRRAKEDEKGYDLHDASDPSCLYYVEHETIRDEGKIVRGVQRNGQHLPNSTCAVYAT